MNEIQQILDASNAPAEIKQAALKLAFEVAAPIVIQNTKVAAIGDGTFMTFLIELLKMLLPILLQLLIPKVP
jgi:hypothetical protein